MGKASFFPLLGIDELGEKGEASQLGSGEQTTSEGECNMTFHGKTRCGDFF